jgi:hypothetical protein
LIGAAPPNSVAMPLRRSQQERIGGSSVASLWISIRCERADMNRAYHCGIAISGGELVFNGNWTSPWRQDSEVRQTTSRDFGELQCSMP